MAKAPAEAAAKAVATSIDVSFFVYRLLAMGWKGTFLMNVSVDAVEKIRREIPSRIQALQANER
jgi:hypothetical protein